MDYLLYYTCRGLHWAMTVIGETLRRERTRRSLDLDQISRQTKISVRLLEAIENEQFEKLPGGVFTKSFVKQYARALGLDEEEIGNELDRQLQPVAEEPVPQQSHMPEPAIRVPRVTEWEGVGARGKQNSVLPALGMVVLVMLICSGIYAWLQRARHPAPANHETASTLSPGVVPASATPSQPAAGAPNTQPPAAPSAQQAGEAGKPESAGTTPPVNPNTATPAPGVSPAAATPPQAVPAAPAGPIGNPTGSVQVTVKASEPVWVKGWVDGKVVLVTTLQANESRTFGASDRVRLRLGNAGGLDVELNGKPLGAPGPKGQIRVVEFTAQGMELVPLTPPVAPQGRPDTL